MEDQSDETGPPYPIHDIDTCEVKVLPYIASNFSGMTAYNTGRKVELGEWYYDPGSEGRWDWTVYTGAQAGIACFDRYDPIHKIWFTPDTAGVGLYPSLAVHHWTLGQSAFLGSLRWEHPVIAWLDNSRRSIWYWSEGWPQPQHPPYQLPPPFPGSYYLSPPSIAIGKDYYGEDTAFVACEYILEPGAQLPPFFGIVYWRFPVDSPEVATQHILHSWSQNANFVPIDTLGVVLGVMPKDTVGMTPYFGWEQEGDIWGAAVLPPYNIILKVNISDTFAIPYPCKQPAGDVYGSFIGGVVVMKAPAGDVLLRGYLGPGSLFRDAFIIDTVTTSYGGTISWPTIRKGVSVTWQEYKPSWQYSEVYCRDWDWIHYQWYHDPLSSTAFGNAYFPHAEIWQPAIDSTERFCVWTEEINPNQYLLAQNLKISGADYAQTLAQNQTLPDNFVIVPCLYIRGAVPNPQFFAVRRDTFVIYNNEPWGRVDKGQDSLVYTLPLLPEAHYGMMVEIYVEGKGGEWIVALDFGEKTEDTISFVPGEVKRNWYSLPQATYRDGRATIRLTRVRGDFTPCSRIIVWEYGFRGALAGRAQATADKELLPRIFALYQNFPNPFRHATTIKYQLPIESYVGLKVYDVNGRLVRRLVDGKQKPGYYTVSWDGKDDQNRRLASGIYFYRLETKEYKSTKKIVRLR